MTLSSPAPQGDAPASSAAAAATAAADTPIRLADYRPPAWSVRHVDIAFELDLASTEVHAWLQLVPDPERAPGTPPAPLRLDGEDLELVELRLDGRLLEAHEYSHDATGLTLPGVQAACVLETTVRVKPEGNTRLEGLYASRGMLFTQCEAEGFRRITFFVDRPDVMPTWRITLAADGQRFPVLLANGNPVGSRWLEGGRHERTWENPHPTPCYLFALVAGELECVKREVRTASGRPVLLAVWAEAADVPRCHWALDCVERSLRWDERRFGREYDLEQFNVVAAQDFTMGAMENKGLNIFNARYILADAATATDADHVAIESVIGHEYFHNWSGNRVTLRDWFQLALKEGLTVFRDQEFTSDLHSRAVKRIEDVRLLRARQFAEDGGALAHPVRPAEYREINNFYTLTVYEKGAEIVRMLHTLLGERTFRAGMDQYFAANDGRAATIEDFLFAFEVASGRDLSHFARWYAQAGTPVVEARDSFDAATGTWTLTLRQSTPPTPGQAHKQPLHLPFKLALYDRASGRRVRLRGEGAADDGGAELIELTAAATRLSVRGLSAPPLPAFNQGFAAPVKVDYAWSADDLGLVARLDADPLTRWDALQRLATDALLKRGEDGGSAAATAYSRGLAALLGDAAADPAFVAECLALPDFDTLAEAAPGTLDVDALLDGRDALLDQLARVHEPRALARYGALAGQAAGGLEGPAMAARGLRNGLLGLLTRRDPEAKLAQSQLAGARTMTERLGALRCLVHAGAPAAAGALEAFRTAFAHDPLVTDKWITLVATRPHVDALADVEALLASAWWTPTNPNRVRALLGAFARSNPRAFHRPDGAGYRLLGAQLPALDRTNPQVAARLLGAFESWTRLDAGRRAHADAVLAQLAAALESRDARETLARLRG
jgi:aminopeptidase N